MTDKTIIGKMLDQIEAAMDHVTTAFDLANEGDMPTKKTELLALKNHLWELHKELSSWM